MVDIMTEQPPTLEIFLKNVHNDIERKIKEMIDDERILSILNHGKRLRPLLASISFKVCTSGNEQPEMYENFLEGSVGVELAHGASLVHDDIIDQDMNRRGKPAFHVKSGIDNAILIGHKMLIIGLDLAVAHGEKFARLYIDAWNGTLDGQLSEVNFNSKELTDTDVSADSKFFQIYSKIIDLKTATLFSAACKVAAIWAQVSDELADILSQYGREVGFAYQLADDLVDLDKGEMIDSVVLPLLSRLEKKSIKNGMIKAKTIKHKLEKNSPEIKQLYINEIKNHLDKAQQISRHDLIPKNLYTQYLYEMPRFIVNRMLSEVNITV
jgi:geranylgeranyl pyrophosphate synthase